MKQDTVENLLELLGQICDRVKEEDNEILIAYGIRENAGKKDEYIRDGVASSDDLEWPLACKMMAGMNASILDLYSGDRCECECVVCEACESL